MPRRKVITKRPILPDSRYSSELVAKLINHVMRSGKKSIAEGIVYGALEKLSEQLKGDALELLEKALDNVRPIVEVRSKRVGGATYQIPVEVRPVRQMTLALRWVIAAALKRNERSMLERLARELQDAYDNRGAAIKTQQDKAKMAAANQAFANYRWNG